MSEVTDWEVVARENISLLRSGPVSTIRRDEVLAFQEMQAAIARWAAIFGQVAEDKHITTADQAAGTTPYPLSVEAASINSLAVYVQGVRQDADAYGYADGVVTFASEYPIEGDVVVFLIGISAGLAPLPASPVNTVYETVAVSDVALIYTLDFSYAIGKNQIQVFVNGVQQAPSSYTESAVDEITFSEPLDVGDLLVVWFIPQT